MREAFERGLPVFAICRGLQLLNAVQGGTLIQHIEGHKCPRRRDAHQAGIAGSSSRHHQCAGKVEVGLVITARAFDGPLTRRGLP